MYKLSNLSGMCVVQYVVCASLFHDIPDSTVLLPWKSIQKSTNSTY